MKKIILFFGLLILAACGRDDDKTCDCTTTTYKRTEIIRTSNQELISATEWEKIQGSETPTDNSDCNLNGNEYNGNSYNLHVLEGGASYSITQEKKVITCH